MRPFIWWIWHSANCRTVLFHLKKAYRIGYAFYLLSKFARFKWHYPEIFHRTLTVYFNSIFQVFGALTSCALHVSDHFYGTGESLLFRFTPHFQVYNWTGENLYFIKGNNESLSIGAGDGKFGLWLDGDLYLGRTETCKTYGNDPLTPKVDFVVKTLECWAFISS